MASGFLLDAAGGNPSCKKRKDIMMNHFTNFRKHSGAARVFSWLMAFALVFSLVAVPAGTASADPNTVSAEVVFSAEGLDMSGKLTLDAENLVLGAYAGMVAGDQTLADVAAYLSAQALAVDSMFLGGAYGVDLPSLSENLATSIFAPDSGSAFALDEETYNQLLNPLLAGEVAASVQMPNINADAIQEAVTVLADVYSGIGEQLIACVKIESAPASVIVNGKPIQVSQIRCTADAEASAKILELLVTPLQGNDAAQAALAALIDEIAAASQQDLGMTGAELVQTIVSELPQMLPEVKEELGDFYVTAIVGVSPETQMPVQFSMEIHADSDTAIISLLMTEAMDFFRLEVTDGTQVVAAFQFEITQNSDTALAWKFSVIQGTQETANLSFELNKTGKAFLVGITADGDTHTVSGYYDITDTLFSLTVDKLDGAEFGGTIALNLRADDSIAMPDFTEVTKLSEEEFSVVVQNAMAGVEFLQQIFG